MSSVWTDHKIIVFFSLLIVGIFCAGGGIINLLEKHGITSTGIIGGATSETWDITFSTFGGLCLLTAIIFLVKTKSNKKEAA